MAGKNVNVSLSSNLSTCWCCLFRVCCTDHLISYYHGREEVCVSLKPGASHTDAKGCLLCLDETLRIMTKRWYLTEMLKTVLWLRSFFGQTLYTILLNNHFLLFKSTTVPHLLIQCVLIWLCTFAEVDQSFQLQTLNQSMNSTLVQVITALCHLYILVVIYQVPSPPHQ